MSASVITGTGSYIPEIIKRNTDFVPIQFFSDEKTQITTDRQLIADKFVNITGIRERRYAQPAQVASTLGSAAAKLAIEDSGIDPETLDLLIVAHNFGDVPLPGQQSDTVPSIASRIKSSLGIANPGCVAFDVLFGCPGWLLAVMQAHAYFKAGMARKALVIGTETLSRVYDPFDRDSMIFSDGAGAIVMEAIPNSSAGILQCLAVSHCQEELGYLYMGGSNNPEYLPGKNFMKMKGRKVYEYALKQVPAAMKQCVDQSGIQINEVKKIFIHQANEKMDHAILSAFYKLYDLPVPDDVMPMNIQLLGNSSVATIPTLLDQVRKGTHDEHELAPGDVILFASVGAGMNINAITYRYI